MSSEEKKQSAQDPWRVYFSKLGKHLARGIFSLWRLVLLVLLIILATIWLRSSLFTLGCRERDIRLIGMLLQFVGFIVISWNLYKAHSIVGLPTIMSKIADWFQAFPRRRRERHTIELSTGIYASSSVKARARILSGPDTPLKNRVENLEKNVDNVWDELRELGDETRRSGKEITDALKKESAERRERDNALDEKVNEAVGGGLHIELYAIILFVFGIVLASAAPEIATGLGHPSTCSQEKFPT